MKGNIQGSVYMLVHTKHETKKSKKYYSFWKWDVQECLQSLKVVTMY